eukprot:m.116309 g.116309  ORF g.116309 m.116309 type:complete len:157 (+) comp10913_c0_seq1:202-672(+)
MFRRAERVMLATLFVVAVIPTTQAQVAFTGTIGCGITVSGNTSDTNATNVVGHAANEHIYGFNLTVPTTVTIDACDVDFDGLIHIFTADLTVALGARDQGGCGTPTGGARLTVALAAGEYAVVIKGLVATRRSTPDTGRTMPPCCATPLLLPPAQR